MKGLPTLFQLIFQQKLQIRRIKQKLKIQKELSLVLSIQFQKTNYGQIAVAGEIINWTNQEEEQWKRSILRQN